MLAGSRRPPPSGFQGASLGAITPQNHWQLLTTPSLRAQPRGCCSGCSALGVSCLLLRPLPCLSPREESEAICTCRRERVGPVFRALPTFPLPHPRTDQLRGAAGGGGPQGDGVPGQLSQAHGAAHPICSAGDMEGRQAFLRGPGLPGVLTPPGSSFRRPLECTQHIRWPQNDQGWAGAPVGPAGGGVCVRHTVAFPGPRSWRWSEAPPGTCPEAAPAWWRLWSGAAPREGRGRACLINPGAGSGGDGSPRRGLWRGDGSPASLPEAAHLSGGAGGGWRGLHAHLSQGASGCLARPRSWDQARRAGHRGWDSAARGLSCAAASWLWP